MPIAATSPHTAARALALLLICVGVVGLAGCGDDTAPAPTASSSSSAAPSDPAGFSGVYEALLTTYRINGRRPAAGEPESQPTTRRWIVQTRCDGPGDGCVSVAAATAPTASNLNRRRMVFVHEGEKWTRVTETVTRTCRPTGTDSVVNEPWVGMQESEFRATGSSATGSSQPQQITDLDGVVDTYQGGSCAQLVRSRIRLHRVGDLPAGTAPLPRTPVVAARTDVPGAGLRGRYEVAQTTVSARPASLARRFPATSGEARLAPVCLRDGSRCITALYSTEGQYLSALSFRSRGFERTTTGVPVTCTNGASGVARANERVVPPANASLPLQSVGGPGTTTYLTGCTGSVSRRTTLTRLGD
ncbi:hypothetical protein ACQ7HM_06935 [Williamsia sp. MIQD14]|uniref:hypothetical protein n=1 Tax=Williamsia sp. MIQD14 TaxID=3425703 RepID=UPI003DA1A94A